MSTESNTINEVTEEVEQETQEVVYSTLTERLEAIGYTVEVNTEDDTLSAEGESYTFSGDTEVLDRIFLTGSAQEAYTALMQGEVEASFDPRDYADNAERWKVVKAFTEELTGVRQNPVTRNLTPSEIASEGRKRDLSRGRPSKWAQALILHTDVTGADVEAWTEAELGVSGRNFKAFAIAHGLDAS